MQSALSSIGRDNLTVLGPMSLPLSRAGIQEALRRSREQGAAGGLWYFCGEGYARARMARHHLGLDVVLCAPGPSMERVERQPGVMIAALTKAYPLVKPDIWFGMDSVECYDRRVWSESFTKVTRFTQPNLDMRVGGRLVQEFPHTYFAATEERPSSIETIFRNRGHDAQFFWQADTLATALHVLVWMGARTIYLNGFDLHQVGGRDYAAGVPKTLDNSLRKINHRLFDHQVEFLRKFAKVGRRAGVQLVSTTLGSPLNAFLGYRPLTGPLGALTQIAREDVPSPAPLLHSFETQIGKDYMKRVVEGQIAGLMSSRAAAPIILPATEPPGARERSTEEVAAYWREKFASKIA